MARKKNNIGNVAITLTLTDPLIKALYEIQKKTGQTHQEIIRNIILTSEQFKQTLK